MEVAQTIIEQLGGNEFLICTGIRKILKADNRVTFQLPRNAKNATAMKITLADDDTYTLETYRIRKGEIITLEKYEGIYWDMLQDFFEQMTELYVTLMPRR